jgi:two-component system, NarL family, response regulator NreC
MAITVFLADNHGVRRDGLRSLLEAQADISVVGHAATGHEAVREVRCLGPDIVIMDIAMPELSGIDATLKIHEVCPSTKVLILSMFSSIEHIFRALQAGADGYLLMDATGAELVEAIRTVHAGHRYLSQKITGTVIDDYIRERHAASPLESLSSRERQILQLIAEGKSSAHAAKILFLSPKTVETYRSRLMRKLGIDSFSSLIKFAIQHGVIPLE